MAVLSQFPLLIKEFSFFFSVLKSLDRSRTLPGAWERRMSDTANVLHELSMYDGPAQASPSCPLLCLITQKHLEAGLLLSVYFWLGRLRHREVEELAGGCTALGRGSMRDLWGHYSVHHMAVGTWTSLGMSFCPPHGVFI